MCRVWGVSRSSTNMYTASKSALLRGLHFLSVRGGFVPVGPGKTRVRGRGKQTPNKT